MELFKYKKPYNFMGKSKIAIAISLLLMFASYALLATKGLNYGIDFTGGTIVQVKYKGTAPIKQMREKLKNNPLFADASITEFGSPDEVIIRMKTSSKDVKQDIGDIVRKELTGTGEFEIRRVDIVVPKLEVNCGKKD